MIDRSDVRDFVGGGGLAGLATDVVLTGGDVAIALAVLMIDQIEIVLAIAAQAVRVSDSVSWIPAGAAESALVVVAVAFVVISVVRLARRAKRRVSDN